MNKKQSFLSGLFFVSTLIPYLQASEQPLRITLPEPEPIKELNFYDNGLKEFYDNGLKQFKKVELLGGTQQQFKKIIKKQLKIEQLECDGAMLSISCNKLKKDNHLSKKTNRIRTINNKKRQLLKGHNSSVDALVKRLNEIKFPDLPVNHPDDYDANIEKTFKFVAYIQALQRRINFNYPHFSQGLKNKYDQLMEQPLKTLNQHIQIFNNEPGPITIPPYLKLQLQFAQEIYTRTNDQIQKAKIPTHTQTQSESLMRAQGNINLSTEQILNVLSCDLMNKNGRNPYKKTPQKNLDSELCHRRSWANECIMEEKH